MKTKPIVTVGDVRDEKLHYWAHEFAMADRKEAPAKAKREHEDAMLAKYPQIGMLQCARGRKFGGHNVPSAWGGGSGNGCSGNLWCSISFQLTDLAIDTAHSVC